jgi:hypothetical protein
MKLKKHSVRKILLTLSLFLILLWVVLGAGTSLAWFADTSEAAHNVFNFAEFDLTVEYRDKNGNYQDMEGATEVFDREALYEPGYVQVVYLRVTNKGTVPFRFKTAVRVTDYTEAINFFGQKFLLQNYLRFGMVSASSEAALDALVRPRENAVVYANTLLNNYPVEHLQLQPKESAYIAVIVRMPEDVDNIANYRQEIIPRVELGLTVTATQLNAPMS